MNCRNDLFCNRLFSYQRSVESYGPPIHNNADNSGLAVPAEVTIADDAVPQAAFRFQKTPAAAPDMFARPA